MEKLKQKYKLEWRTQDWLWLLSLVVFVSIAINTNNKEIMNLISYTSTFVSIALAFIAIYISVREATKTDKIKDETLSTLVEIRERISQVDTKVSSFDIASITKSINDGIDRVFNNLTEKAPEENKVEEESGSPDDEIINEKVKDKLMELSEELKEELKSSIIVENSNDYPFSVSQRVQRKLLEDTLINVYRSLNKKSENGKFSFLMINQEMLSSLNADKFGGQRKLNRMIEDKINEHILRNILSVDSSGKLEYIGNRRI